MISELQKKYDHLVGKRDYIDSMIETHSKILRKQRKAKRIAGLSLDTVKIVAIKTQQSLELCISDTITTALATVFDDPYAFNVEFVERNERTDCNLRFVRNDHYRHPLRGSGIGTADIAAFALRPTLWALTKHLRPVFILDEPFKHLKGIEQNRRAIQLLQEITKTGIQLIVVSDERAPRKDIAAGADRLFVVSNTNGVSEVEVYD